MTSFFSELEEQLRAAAHQQTSDARAPSPPHPPRPPHRRRWAWLTAGARLVPVAAAVAVTLAVVGGALVLLGHHASHAPAPPATHAPVTGLAAIVRRTSPAQLKREFALIGAASRQVQNSRDCHVSTIAPVKVIQTPPGRALLSTLGLLRRPATRADRLPPHALDLAGTGVSVYAGAARRTLGGHLPTFIVPIRQSPKAGFPSGRCFALQTAAVRRALPTMPRQLRAPTWALTNAFIAYDRSLAAHAPIDAICEVTYLSGNGRSSSCGMTVPQIRHGMLPEQDNGTFSGLVPDGVDSVTLRFAVSSGRPARTATARVHDNIYSVQVSGLPASAPLFPTVVWHGASGKVLRTYSEPAAANPQTLQQLCARHPNACAAMAFASSATAVQGSTGPVRRASPAKRGG